METVTVVSLDGQTINMLLGFAVAVIFFKGFGDGEGWK